MEAVGIDVVATAERAGLSLSFAPDAGRGWVGLVLVD
jgi:predicted metal-binding protein